jgi:hypothetical protein
VEWAGDTDCDGECNGDEEDEEVVVVAPADVSLLRFLSLFKLMRDFLLPAPDAAATSNRLRLTCNRRRFLSLSGDKAGEGASMFAADSEEIRRFLPLSSVSAAIVTFFSLV